MVEAANAIQRAKRVIYDAINKGNTTPAISIVQHGFPIDDPIIDCQINTLMHVAAKCNKEQIQKILELNPNVNARDSVGRTALHFACRAGNIDTFQVLTEIDDVDVDAVTNSGVTSLMMAIESGNISLVAECLNANLNPFIKDALDRTAMDYAATYRDVLGQDMRQLIQAAID